MNIPIHYFIGTLWRHQCNAPEAPGQRIISVYIHYIPSGLLRDKIIV